MYGTSCPHTWENHYQKYLFSKLNRTIDQCPPTKDALDQHILRAMLQSYISSKSTQLKEESIGMTGWGWNGDERGDVNPLLTTLLKALKACKELENCKWKISYSRDTCTCKTYVIPCSELCRCDGVCENWYHIFNDEICRKRTQWNLFFVWLYIYK